MLLHSTGTLQSGDDLFDIGIGDLRVAEIGGTTFLVTTSGRTGGLAIYRQTDAGGWRLHDELAFPEATGLVRDDGLMLLEAGGTISAVVEGDGGTLWRVEIDAAGRFDGQTTLAGRAAADLLAEASGGAALAHMAGVPGLVMPDGLPRDFGQIATSVSVGDSDFVLLADQGLQEVAVLLLDPASGETHLAARMGAAEGLGVGLPTDMATVEIGGTTFVVLAAAGSSSLTVMRLTADGELVLTDHLIDTLETRFAGVQALSVVDLGDQALVIAGGGDDGLTVFTLLPDGRMVWRATLEDTAELALTNVTAIDAWRDGTQVRIAVATEADAGASLFALDLTRAGAFLEGTQGADRLRGSWRDDTLVATGENDTLEAGSGDDLLIAGPGRTVLEGGNGRDVFVLGAEADDARIRDFQRGMDRIDLSDWPMLRDPAALHVVSTDWGARVSYRDRELRVESRDGTPLSVEDLFGARFDWADRVTVGVDTARHDDTPGRLLRAGDSGDALTGGAWADRLYGGTGDDTLRGGADDDLLVGGAGDDSLLGGAGTDTLYGNAGRDLLRAGEDGAFLSGGADADRLYGGAGDDTLQGGAGNDLLVGGAGDDSLRADGGRDTLYGNDGDDVLRAGGTGSLLFGGADADRLYGGAGDDTLQGGAGNDLLVGGAGDDSLRADGGSDTLYGNDGADVLRAGGT
ncbi:calcium-binding protein, partial [Jannaschia marina]|uniref:calcium-binding protein n=1 Tax=Jannaschia marina TaxID=2741674 RepID=UPI0015C71922